MNEIPSDRAEIERIADDICQRYDEIAFAGLNRILNLIRGENQNDEESTRPTPYIEQQD